MAGSRRQGEEARWYAWRISWSQRCALCYHTWITMCIIHGTHVVYLGFDWWSSSKDLIGLNDFYLFVCCQPILGPTYLSHILLSTYRPHLLLPTSLLLYLPTSHILVFPSSPPSPSSIAFLLCALLWD
jgi:hypothetical protein